MIDLDKIGDDELFDKVQNLYKILSAFGPRLLSRFWNPMKLFKLTKLGLAIKGSVGGMQKASSNEEKVAHAFSALNTILDFRRANPAEFNEIFDALEDIMQEYKQNPQDATKSISNLMDW